MKYGIVNYCQIWVPVGGIMVTYGGMGEKEAGVFVPPATNVLTAPLIPMGLATLPLLQQSMSALAFLVLFLHLIKLSCVSFSALTCIYYEPPLMWLHTSLHQSLFSYLSYSLFGGPYQS